MTGEWHLEQLVADALRLAPASTARELRRTLASRPGYGHLRRRDVNRVLYASNKFTRDNSPRPRWTLAADTHVRTISSVRQSATHAERARRSRTRDTAARMLAATRQPRPTSTAAEAVLLDPDRWILTQLYSWQRQALTAWFTNDGRGIIEAVTGTGKTHLGLEAASRMHAAGGRSVILVPTVELQRQWVERLAENTPHLSLATVGGDAGGTPHQADVTVALVQSARLRELSAGEGQVLLIADETHRYGSTTWADALEDGYDYRLGLTATLERGNDDGVADILLPYFHKIVFHYTYASAVPDNVVAPFALAFLGVALTHDEQRHYDDLSRKIGKARALLEQHGLLRGTPGEQAAKIAAARNLPGPLGQAARDFQDRSRQRRNLLANAQTKSSAVRRLAPLIDQAHGTVIFTQSKAVADDTAQALREEHLRAAAIHSGMDNQERRANLDGLKDQTLQALCAPKILDEGVDVPNIDLGIIMSASSTRRQMIQRLGRVIRRKPDGRPATLIVLYAEDTVEDPTCGAHQTFLDTVRDVAAAELIWGTSWSVEQIRSRLPRLPHQTPLPAPRPATPPTPTVRSAARSAGSAQDPKHAVPRLLPDRPSPQAVQAAMQHDGLINVRGRQHWAQGWAYALSGSPATDPPDAGEITQWIRGILLEALTDRLLSQGRLPEGNNASTLLRTALIDAFADQTGLPECAHGRLHRSVGVPVSTRTGYSYRKISLLYQREHAPDIAVNFFGVNDPGAEEALRLTAAAGAIAVAIRRHPSSAVPPAGVAVVDLAPVWHPEREGESVTPVQGLPPRTGPLAAYPIPAVAAAAW